MACCVTQTLSTQAARCHPVSRAPSTTTTAAAAARGPRGVAASSRSTRRARVLTMASLSSDGGKVRREVLDRPARQKMNTVDDYNFYSTPRMVNHVDDAFIGQLTELYRQRVPEGGKVLDMCSSWVSHLPAEAEYAEVVGHGMNAEELGRNRRLSRFFVRNLNESPGFAAEDKQFDAVLCNVSVQYLQRPEEVFAEVYRVLKPGGVCIMSFSNRMFYEKAIAGWRDGTGYSRANLVKEYFQCVDGFTKPEVITEVGVKRDDSIMGKIMQLMKRSSGDPFYAVVSYRNFKPVNE